MANNLLPPSASHLERLLADVDAVRLNALDIAIRDIWNPAACPAPFLPWLAWALSVDVWNPDWPEARKRAVIAASFQVHRHKGTRRAVREALEALDVDVTLTEWFEADPPAPVHTFTAEIATPGPVSPALSEEALSMIRASKNVRSHLTALRVVLHQSGATPQTAAALLLGETVCLRPAPPVDPVSLATAPLMAAALYGAETVTAYPLEAA
ncbi:phage tail protein I [Haematospirillum sp. 15-248]|uniref:phage tail protein I n=1 Tax=Haematospirillum sp. 15-248 TaxID=2723107 RepID=UPI00143C9B2B|nr:phage tail protein I [Haematospirillum sp. 15-248]NKD88770.1 phage tail protein I [Haematospirillum sp. 15-248]